MKIAFVSQYNPTESLGGGILRATLSKVEGLAELGHNVTLFCLGDENKIYQTQGGYTTVEVKSWTLIRDKQTNKALLDRFMNQGFQTRSFLTKSLKQINPDVFITTTEGSIGKIALNYSKKNSKKIFFYPHVILSKIEEFVPKENIVGRLLSKYQLVPSVIRFINKSSGVIAINKASETDLKKMGVKVPIKIVPNSIDYELFSEKPKFLLNNPVLTYIGLISERKNQKYLLKVLENLPKATKLVLIGSDFDASYAKEVREYINAQKLDVEIISKASQSVISEVLSKSNVFVSASLLEVQSLSVLEAIASGTPVVMLENETVQDFENITGVNILNQNADTKDFSKEVSSYLEMNLDEYLQISLSLKVFAKRFSKLETANTLVQALGD